MYAGYQINKWKPMLRTLRTKRKRRTSQANSLRLHTAVLRYRPYPTADKTRIGLFRAFSQQLKARKYLLVYCPVHISGGSIVLQPCSALHILDSGPSTQSELFKRLVSYGLREISEVRTVKFLQTGTTSKIPSLNVCY